MKKIEDFVKNAEFNKLNNVLMSKIIGSKVDPGFSMNLSTNSSGCSVHYFDQWDDDNGDGVWDCSENGFENYIINCEQVNPCPLV